MSDIESSALSRVQALVSSGPMSLLLWPVVLCAIAYLLFVLAGGGREVWLAAKLVSPGILAVALGLSVINYVLRFMRWRAYLAALGHCLPDWKHFLAYCAGFSLTITPGKAGEALRSLLLKRAGVPYVDSLAALFSERLSDLIGVLILSMLGMSLMPEARPLVIAVSFLLIFLLLVAFSKRLPVQLQRIAGSGNASRVLEKVGRWLVSARGCHRPLIFGVATGLSLIGWFAEGLALWIILSALGVDIELLIAIFIFSVAMLAGAISLMPGGLGGAEIVMIGALIGQGVDASLAVVATLVLRLCTLWFSVLLGVICLWRLGSFSLRGGKCG